MGCGGGLRFGETHAKTTRPLGTRQSSRNRRRLATYCKAPTDLQRRAQVGETRTQCAASGSIGPLVVKQDAHERQVVLAIDQHKHLASRASRLVVVGRFQRLGRAENIETAEISQVVLRGPTKQTRVRGMIPAGKAEHRTQLRPVALQQHDRAHA